jgi:DNA polymerase III delta prime subunit
VGASAPIFYYEHGANMRDEFLWVEKYRPHKIADCILPDDLKQTFQQFVNDGNIPNLLLTGTAGIGKTTVARAMLDEINADYMIINGSLEGRLIDTLRNEIRNYAGTVSFGGGRKYIILDEADYLNADSLQPGLRSFMEQYSSNCGFILTCNFKNRIIQPLHSRCSTIDFKIQKKNLGGLAVEFMKRAIWILETENIEYDKSAVAEVIKKHIPDWRRVLNEFQRYAARGKIDSGILASVDNVDIKELVKCLKNREFENMRKWVGNNSSADVNTLFRSLYDTAYDVLKQESVPQLILILADYQYKAAFVVDQEINLAACMTQIMIDCEFK